MNEDSSHLHTWLPGAGTPHVMTEMLIRRDSNPSARYLAVVFVSDS